MPDEIDDPEDYANRARNTIISFLEHDLDDYDDGAERFTAEFDHLDAFAEDLALAINAGLGEHRKSRYAEAVARYSDDNKTSIIADIDEKLEEIAAGDRPMFDEVVENELQTVHTDRTTDHRQHILYTWVFDRGRVETVGSAESATHLSWTNFRREYMAATDHPVAFPSGAYRDSEDWDMFIMDMLEERRGLQSTHIGPRTATVEDLQDHIARSRGFPDPEDQIRFGGVWVIGDEDDLDEIRVPGSRIHDICESNEITEEALSVEARARGYWVDDTPPSMRSVIENKRVRYWKFDASIAEPLSYEDDPKDAAEQVALEQAEDHGTAGGSRRSDLFGDGPDGMRRLSGGEDE